MARERLDRFLRALAEADGSDLHVKVGSAPRIRVNGTLHRLEGEEPLTSAVTADMAMAIMRQDMYDHFEHNHEADFAYTVDDLGRFRVNVFRQRGSVAMIFRLVRTGTASFDELGLPEVVGRLAGEHRGLVLVTGPTGSGKTTTLAAMIDWINRDREVHVITIEDPIEVLHRDELASINQREIGVDTVDFAAAMRSAMRQDPDVIFVGEMRDEETVSAALRAADTGHLVLSTLHTTDAPETINRIVDFFPPHQHGQVRATLAGSLKGTICQRLVPTSDGGARVAVLEVMVVNGRIQQCILDPQQTGDIQAIIADGEYYGMQTFDQHLANLYERGVIDWAGAVGVASNPHDLRIMVQQRGLATAGRS